jgi:hypothetical protein
MSQLSRMLPFALAPVAVVGVLLYVSRSSASTPGTTPGGTAKSTGRHPDCPVNYLGAVQPPTAAEIAAAGGCKFYAHRMATLTKVDMGANAEEAKANFKKFDGKGHHWTLLQDCGDKGRQLLTLFKNGTVSEVLLKGWYCNQLPPCLGAGTC